MKKLCEATQAAIVAGSVKLDPVLAAHLAQCPECREFAAFEESVLRSEPATPASMPTLASILSEKARREAAHRRMVHFVLMPLSLAAAALIAVAGLTFTLGTEPVQAAQPAAQTLAASAGDWQLESSFTEEWSTDSLSLAWDTASARETSCKELLSAVGQEESSWNIEVFNPIEEESRI